MSRSSAEPFAAQASFHEDQDVSDRAPRRRDLMAGASPKPIIPKSLSEAYRLAQAVCAAKMAPKGLETPEACMIAIMHGLELGLSPLSALQRIAVIHGRPTLWGDAALGLVKASGLCEAVDEWIEGDKADHWMAVCNVLRRGDPLAVERRFSVDDAKRAKLWSKPGPWTDYPKRMLQMRARAFALRDAFPDVLGGLYITEEVQSLPDPSADTAMAVMVPPQLAGEGRPSGTAPTIHNDDPARSPAKTQQSPEDQGQAQACTQAQAYTQAHSQAAALRSGQVEPDTNAIARPHAANAPHASARSGGAPLTPEDRSLPALANLRRARRMPRSSLSLRFRNEWSIRQPKKSAPVLVPNDPTIHTPPRPVRNPPQTTKAQAKTVLPDGQRRSDSSRPQASRHKNPAKPHTPFSENDVASLLNVYDAALCCASDNATRLEIEEEFEQRLACLPPSAQSQAMTISQRHAMRVGSAGHRSQDNQT